jgi:hypothetical protein
VPVSAGAAFFASRPIIGIFLEDCQVNGYIVGDFAMNNPFHWQMSYTVAAILGVFIGLFISLPRK